jgi:hypothetical protein
MRMILWSAVISALICVNSTNVVAQTKRAEGTSPLQAIITPDMIGATVQFFEKTAGPAWKKHRYSREMRTYKIKGCVVTASIEQGDIRALKAELTDNCSVDLKSFVNRTEAPPRVSSKSTQGAISQWLGNGGKFMASCLAMCGNAADPSVYWHYEGPRADQNLEVLTEIRLVGDRAVDASFKWRDIMESARGDDYVMDTKFNCDAAYDEVAEKVFRGVSISSIAIGFDLVSDIFPKDHCK